ncbi:DUF6397 family protein [Streptomyces sp. MA5143a]|uniref:DUF6397 family protein n=1 Tax=Streptomyces sp. MA5143a TaxID=2083010 RepID=UPI000D1BDC0A|nr:DUF6397 family protein [Streptomyces sp. MA5143a]SPF04055.1 hypothetical protein SMA5143A_4852 [Streptomyces sp. MA5143a]
MSGNTITRPAPPTTAAVAAVPAGAADRPLAQSRAARELSLKRSELDLAVHLGCVRTVPDEGGGGRRVARSEIDRLRAEEGFPQTLRARVQAVGSKDAAAILEVAPTRFVRLARLGLVTPVKFYLNRYRAVVWLYLADEVRRFAADENNAPWLTGRLPQELRTQLDDGLDLRPRNWRGRHLGFLLRQAEDPWARAAAPASLLDPVHLAEIVRDPYERAHLNRHRPPRTDQGPTDSPAARLTGTIMTADDPDEIEWLRADLRQALVEARAHRLAPRPRRKEPAPRPARNVKRPANRPETPGPASEKRHGLLGWLTRRHP